MQFFLVIDELCNIKLYGRVVTPHHKKDVALWKLHYRVLYVIFDQRKRGFHRDIQTLENNV